MEKHHAALLVTFHWIVNEFVLAEIRRVGESLLTKVANVIFLLSVRSKTEVKLSEWLPVETVKKSYRM